MWGIDEALKIASKENGMLEIRQRGEAVVGRRRYDLYLDGVLVTGELANSDDCTFRDIETFRKIGTVMCLEFDESLWGVDLRWQFDSPELLSSIFVKANNHVNFYLSATGSLRHWKKPYSFSEYTAELIAACESLGRDDLEFAKYEVDEDSFEFKFCKGPSGFATNYQERKLSWSEFVTPQNRI